MLFQHVYLLGVGGTGSHLVDPLSRLLIHHCPDNQQDFNFTLIDGDSYEEKNLERQLFDKALVGKNKAGATAQKLTHAKIASLETYVNEHLFTQMIQSIHRNDSVLVILAVDNHATRKDIITAIDKRGLKNFVVISPGNSYSTGQAVVYSKWNGAALTDHPFDKYEELKDPKDAIPNGCAAQTPSTPQLITANACAALATLLTVSAMLDNKDWFDEVHFNCETMKMSPQGEPKTLPQVSGNLDNPGDKPPTPLGVASEKGNAMKNVLKSKASKKSNTTKAKKPAKKLAKPTKSKAKKPAAKAKKATAKGRSK